MNTYNIIKIETAPLSEEELKAVMPTFEAPSNYKDPKKIEEAIAARKAKFIEEAAFDPTTGRVVGIGVLPVEDGVVKDPIVIASDAPICEKLLLQTLLDLTPRATGNSAHLVGWYLERFALPFVCKRAWKLGLDAAATASRNMGLYDMTDLSDVYACGEPHAKPKLADALAFLLDRPRVEESTVFSMLQAGKEEEATQHITRDLELLRLLGQRMGVIA